VIRSSSRRPEDNERGPPLIVATYNIHTCVGIDRRYDPDRIVAVLRELGADIIGLQEVDARHRFNRHMDQWDYFAAAMGFHAVAGANISDHRGRFGNALLTRFPIRAVRHIDLSVGSYEPRGAIAAEVVADGRPLRVIVTHLGLRAAERRLQIQRLLHRLIDDSSDAEALLVLGDLNEWRGRRGGVSTLDRRLGRAPAPRTFPSWLPLLPLDRIYAAGALALGGVRVHRSALARTASDHLPLCASVSWEHRQVEATRAAPGARGPSGTGARRRRSG
jgi:endonuclease/exonuclease/phosphatase family metal-dependent hydrolase